MKKAIYFYSILFTVTSCSGLAIKEKIIDNYYLIAADNIEWTSLSYHEIADDSNYGGLIEPTVFAVGYNNKYMIVKQHPCILPGSSNKLITNYYILPLKQGMDWKHKNGLIGPLTLEQFNDKKKELHIEEIKFTQLIKELE